MLLADVMVRDTYWSAFAKTNLPPPQAYDRNMRILASVLRVDQGDDSGLPLFVEIANKLGSHYSTTEFAIALSRAETFARTAWPASEIAQAHARHSERKDKL